MKYRMISPFCFQEFPHSLFAPVAGHKVGVLHGHGVTRILLQSSAQYRAGNLPVKPFERAVPPSQNPVDLATKKHRPVRGRT